MMGGQVDGCSMIGVGWCDRDCDVVEDWDCLGW